MPDVDEARRLLDATRARHRARHAEQSDRRGLSAGRRSRRFTTLCAERGIALVLDETYRDFMPGGGAPHDVLRRAGWQRHDLIQLYSFSKAYCIPGHRVGAIVAGAGRSSARSRRSWTRCRSARRACRSSCFRGRSRRWRLARGKPRRRLRGAPRLSRARSRRSTAGRSARSAPTSPMSRIPSASERTPKSASGWRASAACSACPAPISGRPRRAFCASPSPMSTRRRSEQIPARLATGALR